MHCCVWTVKSFKLQALAATAVCLQGSMAMAASPLESAEYGPNPQLVPPKKALFSTLNIAKAERWHNGVTPIAAEGLTVAAYANGLMHPRWLFVLPNGDVLVAQAEAPPKPDDAKGLTGKIRKAIMKRAGSGAAPSANRITLLRELKSGVVENHIFLEDLNSPIGMALIANTLYVANSDAVISFPYKTGDIEINAPATVVTMLPAGTINHHWTKSLLASRDGRYLYVGVGSNSNAAENGLDVEKERAAIWQIDPSNGSHKIYAAGLRNPVGLAWEPSTGALWVAVNERDELGDQVPPDYITAVKEGAFYGWPYSYYGQHVDSRVQPNDPEKVATALAPDYALGAHTASLGLGWSGSNSLPSRFQSGMFVGQHGSWNRKNRSGYKVVFVPFMNGKPSGLPIDVLTGFLDSKNNAQGRPVGVAVDSHGDLLVADDVGNVVWRVRRADISSP